jgi:hypothetical protein
VDVGAGEGVREWTYVAGRAHGDLHGQDGPGDDEVEEPLGCGADGYVQGAEAGGGNLAGQVLDVRSWVSWMP